MNEFEAFEKELEQNPSIAFTGKLETFDPNETRGARYRIRIRKDTTARGEFVSKPPSVGEKVVAYKWQKSDDGYWLFETPKNAEKRQNLSGLSPTIRKAGALAKRIEKALANAKRNNLIATPAGVPKPGSSSQYRLATPYKGNTNLKAYTATRAITGEMALLLANGNQWVAFGSDSNGTLRRRDIERGSPMQPPQPCKVLLYFDQNVFDPGVGLLPQPEAANLNNWFFEAIAQYFGADKFYFSRPHLEADSPFPLLTRFKQFLSITGRTVAEVDGIPSDALDGVLVISNESIPFPDPLYIEFLQLPWNTYEERMQGAFPIFSWQGDEENPAPQMFSGNDVSNLRRHAARGGVLGVGEWMNEDAGLTWLPWNRALFGAFGYDSTSMAVLPYTLREFESGFFLNYPAASIVDQRFGTLNRSLVYASTAAAYGNLPANVKGIVRARPPGEARPSWYPDTSDDFYTCVEITKLQPPIEL